MEQREDLKMRLSTLAIFRKLLDDTVLKSLMSYLEEPTASGYAGFVSELYNANGGNLGEHIRDICENNENVYVRTVGRGEKVSDFMQSALEEELASLQMAAEISAGELRAPLEYKGFLPGFASG